MAISHKRDPKAKDGLRTIVVSGISDHRSHGRFLLEVGRALAERKTVLARVRGQENSAVSRRRKKVADLAPARVAIRKAINEGKDKNHGASNYLSATDDSWAGLTTDERKKKIDNLTRRLRKKSAD